MVPNEREGGGRRGHQAQKLGRGAVKGISVEMLRMAGNKWTGKRTERKRRKQCGGRERPRRNEKRLRIRLEGMREQCDAGPQWKKKNKQKTKTPQPSEIKKPVGVSGQAGDKNRDSSRKTQHHSQKPQNDKKEAESDEEGKKPRDKNPRPENCEKGNQVRAKGTDLGRKNDKLRTHQDAKVGANTRSRSHRRTQRVKGRGENMYHQGLKGREKKKSGAKKRGIET